MTRLLVKLGPEGATRALTARELEPLYESPFDVALHASSQPQWFIANSATDGKTPWDGAHREVTAALGVYEKDVLFVEPDLVHDIFRDTNERRGGEPFAVGDACAPIGEDGSNGKAAGNAFAWHLDAGHSQLAAARNAVAFRTPRTRVAHIDTGYFRAHETTPTNIVRTLERSFIEGDANPRSAEDPDSRVLLLDNSGHGTGTLGILAGGPATLHGPNPIGGAPDADVLPLRVADRVVLLRTSALARAFKYAADQQCDVITLSMGGLPSQAWAEAVDALYEHGVCICAAAGNHVGELPPRTIVYPARYARVIAVCGVMANGSPYADLKGRTTLEGSFGPPSAMGAALAAFTPNIPWAQFGCDSAVRLNGEGTSAATPQVAAAATLWFEKYKGSLPRDWRRVEAVRHALFSSARKGNAEYFGNGVLQAQAALEVKPILGVARAARSTHSFTFLRLLTGIGLGVAPPKEQMLNLELAQRWMLNADLQALVSDPEIVSSLPKRELQRVMEAVVEDKGASVALRRHVAERFPVVAGRSAGRTTRNADVVPQQAVACADAPPVPPPSFRKLRAYALDPSFSQQLSTAQMNEVTLKVRWEPLALENVRGGRPGDKRGPIGEYLVIDDVDAAAKPKRYAPVDLGKPELLAQDGWAPAEGNPQFHQQMTYAVVMKTIEQFERALGRPVLWRARTAAGAEAEDLFVQRLTVRPHGIAQPNAFYSPTEVALKFGYFDADASAPSNHMPGSRIYACLSQDIIAHETTHAILDGMQRRFNEPTNPDVLAFHEAFADIVALLQHFLAPEFLEHEIARTRGDIEAESVLGSLAVQFGRASGRQGALREAIGKIENGKWHRLPPDPTELSRRLTPHSRGAILVAAVFDAFLTCYRASTADLFRLSTGGTGELPAGAIHPDLTARLAVEAARVARRVLDMCIRAIDYMPPVDVTFFEYLRALITADLDVVAEDRLNYRVAFVEAFRRRGIYPLDLKESADANTVRTLSVETLRWRGIEEARITAPVRAAYADIASGLREFANVAMYARTRQELFRLSFDVCNVLQDAIPGALRAAPAFAEALGVTGEAVRVEQVRTALRFDSTGRPVPQVIVTITETTTLGALVPQFVGGSTLIVDLATNRVKYSIVKKVNSERRQRRTLQFLAENQDPLHRLLFGAGRKEPFALLHAFADQMSGKQ